MIVVSDSSPLILMARIGCLHILEKMYKTVLIPEAVYREIVEKGKEEGYADAFLIERQIGKLIITRKIGAVFVEELKKLKAIYGEGESEAIILCIQEKANLFLVDDYEPRKIAETRGVKWLTSPGILLTALKKDIINLEEYVKKLGELSQYAWLSGEVVAKFLEAGYKLKGD